MAAAKKSKFVEIFWKVHLALYRWTNGRIGGSVVNMPVLLLTTTGRKSGERRTTALTFLQKGDAYVVIASYLGEPRHPSWWLNLQASPKAEIQVGAQRKNVTAREVDGDEREHLWNEVVARQKDYAEYQQRTTRRIPVVMLESR